MVTATTSVWLIRMSSISTVLVCLDIRSAAEEVVASVSESNVCYCSIFCYCSIWWDKIL